MATKGMTATKTAVVKVKAASGADLGSVMRAERRAALDQPNTVSHGDGFAMLAAIYASFLDGLREFYDSDFGRALETLSADQFGEDFRRELRNECDVMTDSLSQHARHYARASATTR